MISCETDDSLAQCYQHAKYLLAKVEDRDSKNLNVNGRKITLTCTAFTDQSLVIDFKSYKELLALATTFSPIDNGFSLVYHDGKLLLIKWLKNTVQ